MDANIAFAVISLIAVLMLSYMMKVVNRFWIRPKKVEKRVRELGFRGNPYRFFYGDAKEMEKMRVEAISKPLEQLSDDIPSRVLPYHHHLVQKYGMNAQTLMTCLGTWILFEILDLIK